MNNGTIPAHESIANIQKQMKLKYDNKKIKMGKYNILYLNINSIRNKLYELEMLINDLQSQNSKIVHFVALTESRIGEHDAPFFNIPNYASFHCTRGDGYGGCSLFVHNSITCNLVDKVSKHGVELIAVNIIELKLNITVVYKQPTVNGNDFIQTLNEFIKNNGKTIVIGDTNINLLSNSNLVHCYTDSLVSNGYALINKIDKNHATRTAHRTIGQLTVSSRTIIDHVATNCLNYSFLLSLCDTPISDHKEMLIAFDDCKKSNFINTEKKIDTIVLNEQNFHAEVANLLAEQSAIAQTPLDEFIAQINQIKNDNLISKTFNRRSNPSKKWANHEFLCLIRERNRYFTLRKKSPTNVYLNIKYNEISDQIKSLRSTLRHNHNASIINRYAHDPKLMWKHINETIYNRKSETMNINVIHDSDGLVATNTKQIANIFNDYFCNVGKSLHDNLNPSNSLPIFPTTNHTIARSIFLWDVNEEEVMNKISDLKNSKSTKDIIPSHSLKHISALVSPLLCRWINDSFASGQFPNELKCSRIVPIYKEGNPLHVSNYRPISILSSISKVEESILCDRLTAFLAKQNVIHKNQFGFQKNSGALSAASTLVDFLQTGLDAKKNSVACCVFIDLKKAFDTIPHVRLISKLNNYGLRGKVNDLIASYLNARSQHVDISNTFSDPLINRNKFGLPQGSNLGPLLFLIYINDIFGLKLNGILTLYADDAVLVYIDNNIDTLRNKVQSDLNTIASWLLHNKLTLNSSKTKYMLIKPSYTQMQSENFELRIDNNPIERVSTFKYLGLLIQDNLKWNEHVNLVCNKLAGITGAARRFGKNLMTKSKISFYYSMCNSHLSYLCPVWGASISQNETNRLQVAQNNAIRVIFAYEYNILGLNTSEIYQKFKIPKINQLIRINELTMIFKIDKKIMKSSYDVDRNQPHNYTTRTSSLPRLLPFRTDLGRKSIFRHCTEKYRELQPCMHALQSLHTFKRRIKKQILANNNI